MSDKNHLTTLAAGGHTTIIHRPGDGLIGIREVHEPFSTLQIHAFAFSAIADAARLTSLQTAGCYALANADAAYIGESANVAARLTDHAKDVKKQVATQVYVISSKDRSVDKKRAEFCQKHLHDAAVAAGLVKLLNEIGPHTVDLPPTEALPLIRALHDVQRPLFDAGCRVFHACEPRRPATADASGARASGTAETDDEDTGAMEIGVSTIPPGVEEYELRYGELWARGYAHGDRFIVAAGSEVRDFCNGSVTDRIVQRRNALERLEALAKAEGATDRKRLIAAVAFPSAAIAAKTLCGAHVDSTKWRLLGHTPPLVLEV